MPITDIYVSAVLYFVALSSNNKVDDDDDDGKLQRTKLFTSYIKQTR